tara:strand:+ start:123 stop:932 length:810 start_codon:yes stop_codon:yes gene_type:complete
MPRKGLVVLNYHGTPKKFHEGFENQLSLFSKHFNVLLPAELDVFYHGQLKPVDRPRLLICFDDGLKNNLHAAEALENFGLRGLFMVVPAFIDTPEDQQANYYKSHIRPIINPHLASEPEDITPMSWNDLQGLHSKGHEIGCHSYTHTMLKTENNNSTLIKEIVESKYVIEKRLSLVPNTVRTFCGPFNALRSINAQAMSLIAKNYTYQHTNYPGCNINPALPLLVQRVNVETHWIPEMVKFALTPLDWRRWRAEQACFEEVVRKGTQTK